MQTTRESVPVVFNPTEACSGGGQAPLSISSAPGRAAEGLCVACGSYVPIAPEGQPILVPHRHTAPRAAFVEQLRRLLWSTEYACPACAVPMRLQGLTDDEHERPVFDAAHPHKFTPTQVGMLVGQYQERRRLRLALLEGDR